MKPSEQAGRYEIELRMDKSEREKGHPRRKQRCKQIVPIEDSVSKVVVDWAWRKIPNSRHREKRRSPVFGGR